MYETLHLFPIHYSATAFVLTGPSQWVFMPDSKSRWCNIRVAERRAVISLLYVIGLY